MTEFRDESVNKLHPRSNSARGLPKVAVCQT